MYESITKKVEQFVEDALTKADNPKDIFHAKRTAYWIKQLKTDADDALITAGLAHDIERAFYGDWKKGSSDPKMLEKHQMLSAQVTEEFLRSENCDEQFIERVKTFIEHHEEGGNEDQNILCDADVLAYFEEKALRNAKKYKKKGRANEMKKKLAYVFSRLHSNEAKKIAQPHFDEAMQILK